LKLDFLCFGNSFRSIQNFDRNKILILVGEKVIAAIRASQAGKIAYREFLNQILLAAENRLLGGLKLRFSKNLRLLGLVAASFGILIFSIF
jgi:hypothetical protein